MIIHQHLFLWLFIGLGGSLGAVSRYLVTIGIQHLFPHRLFPYATLVINVSGSFLLGIWLGSSPWDSFTKAWFHSTGMFATGFLGGYTTFSTFGVECVQILQKKDWKTAFLYISLSVSLSLSGLLAGYFL